MSDFMRIQVVEVGGVTSKQGKFKPYLQFDLEFIDMDSGKAKKRLMIDFNSGKAFGKIREAQPGATFDVTTKPGKNPEYTDWVDASPVAAAERSEAVVKPEQGSAKAAAVQFKSSYETPEERARKQVYIVRQSSITNAIAYLGENAINTDEVLAVAKQFEAYVFGNQVLKEEVTIADSPEVE